jgi:hypothetical protein
MLLQPFPGWFVETRELNAHTYSAIASPDSGRRVNRFGIQPESNFQDVVHREGHPSLDITATAGDVRRVGAHVHSGTPVIPDFDWKCNPLPRKSPLLTRRRFGSGNGGIRSGPLDPDFLLPGTGLPLHQSHSYFNSPQRSSILNIHHLAARLLGAEVRPDDFSLRQLRFKSGKLCTVLTYVPRMHFLGEWTMIRVHAKDSDHEVYIEARFWHALGEDPRPSVALGIGGLIATLRKGFIIPLSTRRLGR